MWGSLAQKISSASRALTLPRSLICSLTQIERVPVSIATIARSISRKRLATLAELVLESTPIDDFAVFVQVAVMPPNVSQVDTNRDPNPVPSAWAL